ncbi:MAG TPA: Rho termination factor N-terminal domain-containing protein [Mariprofundaceae bacterium]|nr:Rho termination factor N-terminal domain-containing protein [Mariprofundaceae bacterium]
MAESGKLTKEFLNTMAKGLGVKNITKLKKAELIHAIQTAEGHAPCFGRIPDCQVSPCLFRGECIG